MREERGKREENKSKGRRGKAEEWEDKDKMERGGKTGEEKGAEKLMRRQGKQRRKEEERKGKGRGKDMKGKRKG